MYKISDMIRKGYGLLLYIFHWSLCLLTCLVVILTDDLPTLYIMNVFIYLIIQLNVIFRDCPVNIIEDEYIGEEKRAFERMIEYRKYDYLRSDVSFQNLFLCLCLTSLKTGWVFLYRSYKTSFLKTLIGSLRIPV